MNASWAQRLCLASVALLVLALLMLCAGALGVRGGSAHPIVDASQFVVAWGYLVLTPVFCLMSLSLGGTSTTRRSTLILLALWLLALIGLPTLHP